MSSAPETASKDNTSTQPTTVAGATVRDNNNNTSSAAMVNSNSDNVAEPDVNVTASSSSTSAAAAPQQAKHTHTAAAENPASSVQASSPQQQASENATTTASTTEPPTAADTQDLYTDPPQSLDPFQNTDDSKQKEGTLDASYQPSSQNDDEDDDEMIDVEEPSDTDDKDAFVPSNDDSPHVTRRVQRRQSNLTATPTTSVAGTPGSATSTPSSVARVRSSNTKRFKAEVSPSNILPSSRSRRTKKQVDYNRIRYDEQGMTTPTQRRSSSRRSSSSRRNTSPFPVTPSILPRRSRKSVNYAEKNEDDIPDYDDAMTDDNAAYEEDEMQDEDDEEFVEPVVTKKKSRRGKKTTTTTSTVITLDELADEEEEDDDEDMEDEEEEYAAEPNEKQYERNAPVEIILAVRKAPKQDEPSDENADEEEADKNKEDEETSASPVPGDESEEDNYQYFVKFQDTSYKWATWVSRDQIEQQRNGTTKIDRFHRKYGGPEDFENMDDVYFNPQYAEVDRIIAHNFVEGSHLYFVKWKALGYDHCTWEFGHTLSEDQWAIEEFKKRDKVPRVSEMRVPPRPPANEFEKITNEMMEFKDGNELRSYQIEGVNWMIFSWFNRVNGILADEMGLGKTIQTVSMLYYLFKHQHNRGPFLIIAPLSTIEHWKREVEDWTTMNVVVFHGNKSARHNMKSYEFYYTNPRNGRIIRDVHKFNVLITTYEMCLQEKSTLSRINWQYLAVDEGHRLKNKSSKLLEVLSTFSVEHKLLLTGTPIQNDIGELFTLLNYLNPLRFPSRDDFDSKYGNLQNKEQVEELHNLIKPYLLRRMKEDVEKSIPPKEEIVVEVVPTTYQKTYYKALLEGKREFLRQGIKKKSQMPRLVNILMEIRKVCNHPFLISGAETQITKGMNPQQVNETLIRASSKLIFTDKLLKHLKENGHKVLIFSQMVRVLHILEDYLNYRKYNYVRLDGSIKGDVRQEAIDRFNDPSKDVFAFLISTRAGGVGINLMAADTVIIFDSDFNPQNDIQAQARCHRIGQKKEVKVYRLLTKDTKEFELFQRANRKLGLDRAVLSNISSVDFSGKKSHSSIGLDKEEIDILLKHGAYVAYKDDTEEEKMLLEGDIDDILKRSSKVIRWDQETAKKEKGGVSHFSKASFNFEDKNVDLNDEDFWNKVLPQAKDVYALKQQFRTEGSLSTDADRKQFLDDLKVLVDRAEEQMSKFEWSLENEELANFLTGAMYSKKLNEEQRETVRTWLEKIDKRKRRSDRREFTQNVEPIEDEDGELDAFVPIPGPGGAPAKKGGWYKSEREKLFRALINHGWGKWDYLKEHICEKKQLFEIRSMSEAVVQYLIDECRSQEDEGRKEEKEATTDSKNKDKSFKRRNYKKDINMLRSLLSSTAVDADSLKEKNSLQLTIKNRNADTTSILPCKGLYVDLPTDKKLLEGDCTIEIIEQASTDEADELTPSDNMCVRMIELNDTDKNLGSFKVCAPGYHGKFTVRLITPNYSAESEVVTVRGIHPQFEEREFQQRLSKNHKTYVKKLRFSNNLTKLLSHYKPKPKEADVPSLSFKTPAKWWDKECDIDLLVGISSHGAGKFLDLRIDQSLCFPKKLKEYAQSLKTRREKDKVDETWPSTTVLSKRVERLVDVMLKNTGLWESFDSAGTVNMSREWAKSERGRFIRDMSLYGGHPTKDGEPSYAKIISEARLTKSPQYMRVYIKAFLKMCARVSEMTLSAEEKPKEDSEFKTIEKDVEEVTKNIGKRILERFRLWKGLAMYVFDDLKDNVTKFNRHTKKKGSGLPMWYKVNTHDVDLVKGVKKHGIDARAIMDDQDLSFHSLTEDQKKKIRDALVVKRLDDFRRFMEKLVKCGSPKSSGTLWDYTKNKQTPGASPGKSPASKKSKKDKKQSTLPFLSKKRKRISLDNDSTTTTTTSTTSNNDRKIPRKRKRIAINESSSSELANEGLAAVEANASTTTSALDGANVSKSASDESKK